jgi:threonine/homoserine/homoserine lactone efflux protein
MLMYLATGVIFGLSAGLAPGPLLTLVLAQSLRHGFRAGARAALAPLATDLPIVALSLLVISRMASSHLALGLISLAGALFLLYLGYETFSSGAFPEVAPGEEAQSLRKGIVTNFLSPHPYLFWMTVGAPSVMRAWQEGPGRAVAFVSGFYLCLVGSKIIAAALTDRGRAFVAGRAYALCMRGLGILLWVCAIVLASEGVRFFQA